MTTIRSYICSVNDNNSHNTAKTFLLYGRVVDFRRSGGISFGHIQDQTGKVQFAFRKNEMGDNYKSAVSSIKIGVHIEIEGTLGQSSTGEATIFATRMKLLQDVWRGYPDKINGISDPEQKVRKRYLDCILNPKNKEIFKVRSKILGAIRNHMDYEHFMEVDTPVLSASASGAQARPFVTHHNALNAELYMRIAPETYLKRAVLFGFEKVYEMGKNFRNEGLDPSHLQEFTSIEWYAAYHTAEDNMEIFSDMMMSIHACLDINMYEDYARSDIFDLTTATHIKYRDLFFSVTGQQVDSLSAQEVETLFKRLVRPTLQRPTFVTDYPAFLAPMAARKENDPNTADMWQFIYQGWEVAKCYTELTDPVLQRKLLEEQMEAKQNGDDEAMALEEDFLEAMEYGMPPMSGCGVGIDRLISLITNKKSLREVVMFPTLAS